MGTKPTYEQVWEALEKSVALQGHYAELLNLHDGGNRFIFTDAAAWVQRLEEIWELNENKIS